MGTKLPRKLEQKMQIVGEQIRLARLRRNLSIAQIAERATCSPLTVSRIEKGCFMRFSWMTIFFCLQKKIQWERPCKIWALRNEKEHPKKNNL